ncbi:MAG: 3-oxoacyl-[acyl-carrier-protein] reductase [Deltaproteobacteria bacterium]|nr:3-oxoacyl-[acyl-carrier-protein] reductase [Deltaproteobacteria bacterium]
MGQLKDKIALVTGASRGIGRAIAVELAREGAKVIVNYAGNEAAAAETARLIKEAGGPEPILLKFDVASQEQVDAAFDEVKTKHGGLHILVNNAGISKDGLLLRFKQDDWLQTLGTNLTGSFHCARAGAKLMTKQRWGRIINISSVVGESGNAGQVAYAAAKAGLLGLTKTLAQELASRSITVNAVTPGFIATDMTSALTDEQKAKIREQIPLGDVGKPEDVAHAVVFLATDRARYITGHVLAVNGGMYM